MDVKELDEKSSGIALFVGQIMKQWGLSIRATLTVVIFAFCKILQAVALSINGDQKELGRIVCEIVTNFFENGGDSRMTEIFDEMAKNNKSFN
jgi:hypothetical protein